MEKLEEPKDRDEVEREKRKVKLDMEPLTEESKRLYSNFVQINHTPWDFTLHFGHFILPTAPPEETKEVIPVKAVARITVPSNLVKAIVRALQTNIDAYEKAYGPLPE